jgi:multidrug efflux pump
LAGTAALIYVFFAQLPRELAPMEDRGRVWVRATGLEGVGYEYMQARTDELAHATVELVPESHLMMTQVPGMGGGPGVQGAVNSGFVRVFLKDKSERKRTQAQIADSLRVLQKRFNGVRVNITQEASVGERRANETGVRFVVQAVDMAVLEEALPKFLAAPASMTYSASSTAISSSASLKYA